MDCAHGHLTWIELEDAADAIDDILELAAGPSVAKAVRTRKPSPLTRTGFERAIRTLIKDTIRVTSGPEKKAMQEGLRHLDIDWKTAAPASREIALAQFAAEQLKLPQLVGPSIEKVIRTRVEDVTATTKERVVEKYGFDISPSLDVADRTVIDFAAESQAHYVRDEYGRRHDIYSAKARDIVADGLESGLDSAAIAEELDRELTELGATRSLFYWRIVASIHTARARSYGQIRSFQQAGVETYQYVAVMDEVTCSVCAFLDGKIFTVEHAAKLYQDVAESDDPESIVDLQPFIRVGRDDDGGKYLYMTKGDADVRLANIMREPEKDDPGEYEDLVGGAKGLEDIGAGCTPPSHELCRCDILPSL